MLKIRDIILIFLFCFLILFSCVKIIPFGNVKQELNIHTQIEDSIYVKNCIEKQYLKWIYTKFQYQIEEVSEITFQSIYGGFSVIFKIYENIDKCFHQMKEIFNLVKTVDLVSILNTVSISLFSLIIILEGIEKWIFAFYKQVKIPIIKSKLEDFRKGLEIDIWFSHVWAL